MFLLNNKNMLEQGYIGANHKNLSYDFLEKFMIPITTITYQTEIVQYLDKLEAKKNSIDEEISDIDTLMKLVLEQSYN